VAIEHRQGALGVGGITGLDDDIEDQPALAGGQVKLMSVLNSPQEGTGFEPSVPRQEKWSMPSSSDQTRVGRTLTLGGGAESSLEGRDIELSVSPRDNPWRDQKKKIRVSQPTA